MSAIAVKPRSRETAGLEYRVEPNRWSEESGLMSDF